MVKTIRFCGVTLGMVAVLMLIGSGCSKQEAVEAMKNAEDSAEEAAESISDEVSDAVKEGEEMASDLGEKATAFLSPLKEKVGNLESLKNTPDELKKAVTDLIQSLETKAEDLNLPEAVSSALATVKEKLMALKTDLDSGIDQAKIDEHLKSIMDSVKSELGMAGK